MLPMERLTWVSGSFSARVLEARLNAEGIDVALRGAIDSPYMLTVGDMARVDVYVPTDQLDDARLVMLAAEVDSVLAPPREWGGDPPTHARYWRWAATAGLVAAALAPLARLAHS